MKLPSSCFVLASLALLATGVLPAGAATPVYTIQTYPVGRSPRGMVSDGTNLWVVDLGDNAVSKLRLSDGALLGTFPTGVQPLSCAFDGANIWVANFTFGTLTKLRASDGAPLGTFPTQINSLEDIVFDGTNLWVVGQSFGGSADVSKIRPSDGAVLTTLTLGSTLARIVFDGANVWISDQIAHTVTKIRVSDNAIVGVYNFPSAYGITFDGTNIWVANNLGKTLTKVRASDGVTLGTFTAGTMPLNLATDGVTVWTTFSSRAGKPPSNVVSMLRTKTGARAGSLTVGTSALNIYFDGTSFWVPDDANAVVNKITKQ